MLEPILEHFVLLEQINIFSPLGIRFWDAARDVPVSDGLIVTAQPLRAPTQVTSSFRTLSGIYAFQGLPGMHAAEYPEGGVAPAPLSPPAATTFLVQVTDTQRRFLPVVFEVDVPHQGLFPAASTASPPGQPPPGFCLFSAPTRRVTTALAVLRAQVAELVGQPNKQRPAAHAWIEVEGPGSNMWYGLADEQGSAVVLLPYPDFTTPLHGSPPAGTLPDRQRWQLSVRVHYSPSYLNFPPGSRLPELRSVLRQPAAKLWSTLADSPGDPVARRNFELIFGEELVMRTGAGPTLIVSPAASPP